MADLVMVMSMMMQFGSYYYLIDDDVPHYLRIQQKD
jgi:hypothetical protein